MVSPDSISRRAFITGLAAAPMAACGRSQPAAQSPASNAAVFMMEGADREARLVEGARREGLVSIYTSFNTQDSAPLVAAFEKKYGVKTELWRSASERVVQRGTAEARAGRFTCDVFETNGPEMEALHREQLLDEFKSPNFADLLPAAFPSHRQWVADRFNFFTIAYNTNLVRPEEVPNTYDDLLHPRFAGRIGLEAGDVDWFGAMVKHMGDEKGLAYFRALAASAPKVRSGHTLIGHLVASGEIPLAANVYNHSAERVAAQGAPIKWKALAPTFGRPNAVGVARRAPHPHAAVLFADFVLSRDGQQMLTTRYRVPSSNAVESNLNDFPFETIDPAIVLDEDEKWEKLWSAIFLQGQAVVRDAG